MEYDGSYIGQLRTDDCIEYPPRIARYLRAQRIVTKVHQEACQLGAKLLRRAKAPGSAND